MPDTLNGRVAHVAPDLRCTAPRELPRQQYEENRPDNWRGVPAEEHLNHALRHLVLWQAVDDTEDHVGHVLARMMMWGDLVL